MTGIYTDGCVDIIFNILNEKVYLVGTMTCFKETSISQETNLLGIRFKPAAFSVFYKFGSLHEITDQTVELEKHLSPDIQKTIKYSTSYLNHFFLNKLSTPKNNLLAVVADIKNHKGQLDISTLAHRHFMTIRQLERNFKQHIGISQRSLPI